jgi:hypothetical protein
LQQDRLGDWLSQMPRLAILLVVGTTMTELQLPRMPTLVGLAIVENPALLSIDLSATEPDKALLFLNLSSNPMLRRVAPILAASLLNISYTQLPYDAAYCTSSGTGAFLARSVASGTEPKISSHLKDLVSDCYRANTAIFDLSDNAYMNTLKLSQYVPTYQAFVVRGTTLLDATATDMAYGTRRASDSALGLHAFPHFILRNVPVTCSVHSFYSDSEGADYAVSPLFTVKCSCSPSFHPNEDDVCVSPVAPNDGGLQGGALAGVLIASLLAGSLLAVGASRIARHLNEYSRRYRKLVSEHDLATMELEERRAVWGIPHDELQLLERIAEGR